MGARVEMPWRERGLEGLRWILLSEPARELLRDRVASMLRDGAVLSGLRLRRASWKPKRGVRASYSATVEAVPAGPVATRPLSVSWLVDQLNEGPSGPPGPTVPEHVAAPFRRLRVSDPNLALDVWAWPYDPWFPHLAQAADARYAADLLANVLPERRRGNQGGWAVKPVRYVPHHAHVLRYDPPDLGEPPGPGTVFAKLYADPRECALRRTTIAATAEALEECCGPGAAARPIGETAGMGILLYPWVAGASLASHLRRGAPELGDMLRTLGTTVRALHRVPPHPGLPARSLSSVIAGAAHEAVPLERLLASGARGLSRLLEMATAAGERLPPEPEVLVHGDLKAEHARVPDPKRITLIDLDSMARAEPGVDLGQLLGNLRWEFHASGRPGLAEAQQDFLDGYRLAGDLPPGRVRRARIHELVVFVWSAARGVRFWQPDWEAKMEEALAAASIMADDLMSAP